MQSKRKEKPLVKSKQRIDRQQGIAWIDEKPGRRTMMDWMDKAGPREWLMSYWISESRLRFE